MAKTNARGAEIAEQMAGLAAVPSTPEPVEHAEPAAERPSRSRRARPAMPAEQQSRADRYPHRLTVTISTDLKRELALARATDGVDSTSRIRALLALWADDARLRARADKLALAESSQDRQARGRR